VTTNEPHHGRRDYHHEANDHSCFKTDGLLQLANPTVEYARDTSPAISWRVAASVESSCPLCMFLGMQMSSIMAPHASAGR
jgi:hypothetical protein